jgi:hypothetical protein
MNPDASSKTDSIPILALRLRALVLALGESVDPAWWKTGFLNETGLRFLERLFPRTYFRAAIHSAGKAASDVHDQAVGRAGVYHLFRLPESLETEIYRTPPDSDADFSTNLRTVLGQKEKLMDMLSAICSDEEKETVHGAKRIGTDNDLMNAESYRKTAAIYFHAFITGKPVFPYFASDINGGRG